MVTPTGLGRDVGNLIVAVISCERVSTTFTVPPISVVTQAYRPSGENAAARGRASTRTFAMTTPVGALMIDRLLLVSAVTYTVDPSGESATPSGSIPTIAVVRTLPVAASIADMVPASSFDAYRVLPSFATANC